MAGRKTYVDESPELRVIWNLIVNPILRDGAIRNIVQVRAPKVQNRIVHRGGDALDDRMFLSLDLEEPIQESLVMSMQLADVVEHISDESVQSFPRDDGWICRT